MRKVIHKLFWAWDFDREEKWLNDMAVKGLALVSVGLFRYEFEDCVPGEYRICLEFLEHGPFGRVENAKYIEFLEETGAQHVGTFMRWAYFRKKAAQAGFDLFSDYDSRIRHLTRIIRCIALVCALDLYWSGYDLFLYIRWRVPIGLAGAAVCLLLAILGAVGLARLVRKRQRLKSEQRIFE